MKGFVDCYIFDINELRRKDIFEYALNQLPKTGLWNERKKRIFSYLKIEDKMRSLGGGLLLKYIFDTNHNNYNDLRINKYGKLYIGNLSKLKFNISHSGDFVVCTFGDYENGVDIEKINVNTNIAKRLFTEKEYQIIEAGFSDMFTRIWTIKESYIKERGMGFVLPLNTFEVHPGRIYENIDSFIPIALSLLENTVVIDDLEAQFREFKYKEYYISICSRAIITDSIKKISICDII